jgi:hypothetical protein
LSVDKQYRYVKFVVPESGLSVCAKKVWEEKWRLLSLNNKFGIFRIQSLIMETLMKFLISFAILGIIAVLAGCGSAPAANSNAANANIGNTRVQNVNASDLPPGVSASPIAPVNDSAHAPANATNSLPKGTAPDANVTGKPIKPGVTPTPGIPDPATLKKQMEEIKKRLNSNSNQQQPPPPPPGAGDGQMMRKKPRMSNSNN